MFTTCCAYRPASSTPKASRPTSSSSTANPPPKNRGVRAAPAFKALDLRSSALELLRRDRTDQQTLHPHRKPLKRSDLDDFVACWFGGLNPSSFIPPIIHD